MGKLYKINLIYNISIVFFILLMIYLSFLQYPTSFTIYRNQISHLGSPIENPSGYKIFNAGIFIFGLLIIPMLYFLFRIYSNYMLITSKIAVLFGSISAFALILLPFYPVENWTIHWIIAEFIFIGFIGLATSLCIIWLVKISKKLSIGINLIIFLLYISIYVIFMYLLVKLNTFSEWLFFISILSEILLLSLFDYILF